MTLFCRHFWSVSVGEARWLMISVPDAWSSGPGSSPGRVIVWCSWERHFTLTVPLSIQEYKRGTYRRIYADGKPCDGLPSHPYWWSDGPLGSIVNVLFFLGELYWGLLTTNPSCGRKVDLTRDLRTVQHPNHNGIRTTQYAIRTKHYAIRTTHHHKLTHYDHASLTASEHLLVWRKFCQANFL